MIIPDMSQSIRAQATGVKRAREAKAVEEGKKKAKANPKALPDPDCCTGPHFHGYDLTKLPGDAWPQQGKANTGKHGYTVTADNNAVIRLVFLNFVWCVFFCSK